MNNAPEELSFWKEELSGLLSLRKEVVEKEESSPIANRGFFRREFF